MTGASDQMALGKGSSLEKQELLNQFSRGEINNEELSRRFFEIRPSPPPSSLPQKVFGFVFLVIMLIVPSFAKRDPY